VISSVRLPAGLWDELLRHATEAAPQECCGLLLGRPGCILETAPAPNVAADPIRRFEVDPKAHFDAIRRARATGLDLIGAYHSHPDGAPVPSETDRSEAVEDEEFLHVIVAPRLREIAAYSLITGNFVAVPLVRTD